MNYILLILSIAYCLLMLLYRIGWGRTPFFNIPKGFIPQTRISIIIPARNEEKNIGICIYSILGNLYPEDLYEIIVVDDFSEDATASIVKTIGKPNVRCISLSDYVQETADTVAYKKKALAAGIAQSTGELIITTDADCIAAPHWLRNMAALYEEKKPAMIVAPVDFTSDNSVVQLFQSLDFMTMQGITVATLKLKLGNMSNGANLAFRRQVYDQVDGYTGTENLASGDDYLLMNKIVKSFPGQIAYLKTKDAIIRTAPQPDWASFLQQRIRWASKSGKYKDHKLTSILLLVYAYNVCLLVLLVWGIFQKDAMNKVLSLILLKTAFELIFLFPVSQFFNKRKELLLFPFLQPLHIFYIVSAGFMGFMGKYQWKGRTLK